MLNQAATVDSCRELGTFFISVVKADRGIRAAGVTTVKMGGCQITVQNRPQPRSQVGSFREPRPAFLHRLR